MSKKRKGLALMLGLLLLVVGLAGCGSKEINGMKAYKSEITSMKVQSNNLVKIEGTTSAPDGSAMIIADSKKHGLLASGSETEFTVPKAKNGKFDLYILPYQFVDYKKGSTIKLFVAGIESGKLSKKDISEPTSKVKKLYKALPDNFEASDQKVDFDAKYDALKYFLGNEVEIHKSSSNLYTILPKEDTELGDQVTEAIYGDLTNWEDVTRKIMVSSGLAKATIVLLNPENPSLKIYTAKNAEETYDAVTEAFGDSEEADTDEDSDTSDDTTDDPSEETTSDEETSEEADIDEEVTE